MLQHPCHEITRFRHLRCTNTTDELISSSCMANGQSIVPQSPIRTHFPNETSNIALHIPYHCAHKGHAYSQHTYACVCKNYPKSVGGWQSLERLSASAGNGYRVVWVANTCRTVRPIESYRKVKVAVIPVSIQKGLSVRCPVGRTCEAWLRQAGSHAGEKRNKCIILEPSSSLLRLRAQILQCHLDCELAFGLSARFTAAGAAPTSRQTAPLKIYY